MAARSLGLKCHLEKATGPCSAVYTGSLPTNPRALCLDTEGFTGPGTKPPPLLCSVASSHTPAFTQIPRYPWRVPHFFYQFLPTQKVVPLSYHALSLIPQPESQPHIKLHPFNSWSNTTFSMKPSFLISGAIASFLPDRPGLAGYLCRVSGSQFIYNSPTRCFSKGSLALTQKKKQAVPSSLLLQPGQPQGNLLVMCVSVY